LADIKVDIANMIDIAHIDGQTILILKIIGQYRYQDFTMLESTTLSHQVSIHKLWAAFLP